METDHGTDHDDLIHRLNSLGTEPVEPSLASRHLTFLAAAGPATAHRRRRPAITAAFVAGVLLGGTGLAAALPGPLPTQAASVASSALKAVNPVNGPKDPAKAAAKAQAEAARATAKSARVAAKLADGQGVVRYYGAECTGFTAPYTYNHGQYVKAHPDVAATTDKNERQLAAESDCGKPLQAVTNKASAAADAEHGKSEDAGKSEDSNKPADAGKPAVTGQPASPGKSDATHPATGSDENSDGPGNSEEHRPEDAGTTTSAP